MFPKKNLVTGGAGFIGSRIVDKLLNQEEFVYCLDDLSNGSLENISKWSNNRNFEFIDQCVTKPLKKTVDKIWHFACTASPELYLRDPISTANISFNGTLNMLNLAKENNAKFLFSSSSEIYGNPIVNPQEEKDIGRISTSNIRACYSESKRLSEVLCFDFVRKYDLDVKIPRIFNTYGPNMSFNDGRVIGNFIKQAFKNQYLTIFGNGKQTRSFCFIDDLIDGLMKLMDSDLKEPVNLGNTNEISINELAEIIINLVESKVQIKNFDIRKDEPLLRKPSINKAKVLLNWEPKIQLKDGLSKTILHYKNYHY